MKLILTIILYFLFSCSNAYAAVFALELISPKAAGSGSPAIPSTNRIFYAYPGIEYNIRAAVIGGTYPYTYSLSNAPSGMTIKSRTGEITWTNPTSNASNIVLTVTDSDSTQVQGTWSITVTSSTNYFIFVDSSYSGSTETGSITQPYKSISSLLTNTGAGDVNKLVYFRGGSYTVVAYNDPAWVPGLAGMSLEDRPFTWLGYPGETVNISGGNRWIMALSTYWDKLNFSNFREYGVVIAGDRNYNTIRRCTFTTISTYRGDNNNQGWIFAFHGGSNGYYLVIQDNELSGFNSVSGIGDLYDTQKALLENNYIHSPVGGGDREAGMTPKSNIDYITIRGNKVIMDYDPAAVGWYMNSAFYSGSSNNELCFNLFVNTSASGYVHSWNSEDDMGSHYYWRNTAVGPIHNFVSSPAGNGPFSFTYSVFQHTTNEAQSYSPTYVTYTNNLTGSVNAGFVNASNEYKLQGAYTTYVGTRGWQLSDGYTPMELGDLEEPSGTTTSSMQGVTMIGGTLR